MKANLMFYFAYNEKPENEQDKMISNLIMSFSDFCDATVFEFQCIPRVGEYIIAEDMIKKWLENKKYKKPCPDDYVWRKFYSGLKTGCFRIMKIQHSLTTCTIECTDIEDEQLE